MKKQKKYIKKEEKSKPKVDINKKEPPKKEFTPKIPDQLDYKNKVEALLFSAGKKLDVDFIAGVLLANDKIFIKKALLELKKDYDEKNSSLMIVDDGNFWKITVREKYLPIVRKIVADTELSKSVMETLAVIAWKSPVLQSDVIKIRTNKAYDHIGELIGTGFVTKEKHGRSFILKIAQKFYDYFDVEGKEGIRQVFSKIKEAPVQKKVDEFKGENLGKLKVTAENNNDSVREAEEEMEKKKVGRLEVYGEDQKQEEKQDEEEYKTIDVSSARRKEALEKRIIKSEDDDSESAEDKTKRIVKHLLEDEESGESEHKVEEE